MPVVTPCARVDRFAECGAVLRRVLGGHGADAQVLEALLGHGEADQAASVLGHEVDGFGRDLFGGEGEVAFILAVFVVDDHDHAASADFLDGIGDIGERSLGAHNDAILAEGGTHSIHGRVVLRALRILPIQLSFAMPPIPIRPPDRRE